MPIEEVSALKPVHRAVRQKSKAAQKKAAEDKTPQKSAPRETTDSLTENAKKLYSVLTTEPRHIDDLSEEAKLLLRRYTCRPYRTRAVFTRCPL